jgi:hypothetical protein
MKPSLAASSLILFGLSVLFLIALTAFESALLGLSAGSERILTVLLLVIPAGIGAVLGASSLFRREGHPWQAIAGLTLNTLFALFHLMITMFAG